jgi:hypothetical protein
VVTSYVFMTAQNQVRELSHRQRGQVKVLGANPETDVRDGAPGGPVGLSALRPDRRGDSNCGRDGEMKALAELTHG